MHANTERVSAALEAAHIAGRPRRLDSGATTAAAAAALLGCDVGAIANSLVFTADDGIILVMTSGAHRVDTEYFAGAIGAGRVGRASADQVRSATGQPIGGVAPTGHPAPVTTYVDPALAEYPTIWAAAGTPDTVFPLAYDELVRLTNGTEQPVVPSAAGKSADAGSAPDESGQGGQR
ncbi:YbaK/EbsC family protein [Spelaeicoccus albus]|uniref:Prolyl-tRNA editing enzyme YbaK/EbsC (Cys-tRNA(Pro) deacylase) n=1 Tax=Spelaeicoccus albus TaxID=1280376 RepID=A0A7Z0A9D5_9MICO|nr:YbaK/EbsC family protein [Spelaeicoccus albus]NYI65765.1 prolyl-tRNA editing enzyme YbaK/EbsC (Cys-tRNA(Pro) deacylase) [Spelaeicoccus albus]